MNFSTSNQTHSKRSFVNWSFIFGQPPVLNIVTNMAIMFAHMTSSTTRPTATIRRLNLEKKIHCNYPTRYGRSLRSVVDPSRDQELNDDQITYEYSNDDSTEDQIIVRITSNDEEIG